MKSICYVHKDIGDIERGGISTLFKTLAKGAHDEGWKVYCLTQQELTLQGIETVRLGLERDPITYSRNVSKVIGDIAPDIAECSTWRFELLSYSSVSNRKTKVVVRCEPPANIFFANMDSYSRNEKRLCNQSDFRIAVSNFAKRSIEEKYSIQVEKVIHNGINSKNLRSMIGSQKVISHGEIMIKGENRASVEVNDLISKNKTNIFWCGKATKMKGYDYLGNIISASDTDKYNWIVNLGNSPEEIVWGKKIRSTVTFIRNVPKDEQISIWSKCDVTISTSRNEGFGLVVAESLALGVPILLNKNCEVFREFSPNEAIQLTSVTPSKLFLNIEKLVLNKSNKSYLPTKFEAETMVSKSLSTYKNLLR